MTVFMLVVADIIPATSDVVPLVGIFFNASMVEMVIMIVVLCYIMRLYHKDADDPPMSLWTRRYVFFYFLNCRVFNLYIVVITIGSADVSVNQSEIVLQEIVYNLVTFY